MRYPKSLKLGDTIGICAPSAGISKPEKIIRLDAAIERLKIMGFNVVETESIRKDEMGRSASAEIRAKEFMSLYEDPNVDAIIFAAGGDFLVEILDYLDFERIKNIEPKWLAGYSDITVAIMGCAVNGPGEAREADIGIAGGIGEALLFKKGEIIRKIPEENIVEELKKEILLMIEK